MNFCRLVAEHDDHLGRIGNGTVRVFGAAKAEELTARTAKPTPADVGDFVRSLVAAPGTAVDIPALQDSAEALAANVVDGAPSWVRHHRASNRDI